jgi:hypothetical protein
MGWKASLIFIKHSPQGTTDEQVLNSLSARSWDHTGDASFEEAMNADETKIYIARLNDLIVVGKAELPIHFLNEGISFPEQNIIDAFKDAEICALSLESTVNHWGYGIIQQGKKIRARGGNYEAPLFIDYGKPLPEEEDLLSRLEIKGDNSRVYRIEGYEYTEDQVGENFVFEIAKRYTGYSLDNGNNPLDKLTFKCYEKSLYVDHSSVASSPGQITLSDEKYERLEPEQFGHNKVPLTGPDGQPADGKKYIKSSLQRGDCNPAFVYQLNPLIVIAYAYDIDCIIPVLFPKAYQPPFELVLNQRLLSVNMYGQENGKLAEDLIEGKDSSNVWKTFVPHIAELYSDDTTLIEEKKAAIEEKYWQRLPILAKEYFEANPGRYRLGLNVYTGFPLVYKRPTNPSTVQKPKLTKRWWQFWN